MSAPATRIDGEAVAAALGQSALVVAQIDLSTLRIVFLSPAAASALGVSETEAVGRPVSTWIDDVAHGGLPLLAMGRLDGFEVDGSLRRPDGSSLSLHVWVHVLGDERPARYAVAVGDQQPGSGPHLGALEDDVRVVGTVDGEWRIDRISCEVEHLLGHRPVELVGSALLPLVHPNDVADLLSALAHVHRSGRSVVSRLRLRTASGQWQLCRCRMFSLSDKPAFAFALRPGTAEPPEGDVFERLSRDLERIAQEVRVAELAESASSAPTVRELPALSNLTSREWEVVVRLPDGTRVPTIARELGLSASTVRNHLSSIFQKLEVRSQAELLETLRSARLPAQRGGPGVPARP